MNNLSEKFEKLFRNLSSPTFLNKEALGGEIPFFISTYNPEEETEVSEAVKGLCYKLEHAGIPVLEINLYDLALELLDRELGVGEVFELEKQMSKGDFKDALQSVLDLHTVFMPEMERIIQATPKAKVYFVTGVGQVYPFIRSHNILNNLQRIATDAPTVMFFPGKYDGHALSLFNRLKDDNYYRAFNLDNYNP